jgi:hypothetical protein
MIGVYNHSVKSRVPLTAQLLNLVGVSKYYPARVEGEFAFLRISTYFQDQIFVARVAVYSGLRSTLAKRGRLLYTLDQDRNFHLKPNASVRRILLQNLPSDLTDDENDLLTLVVNRLPKERVELLPFSLERVLNHDLEPWIN